MKVTVKGIEFEINVDERFDSTTGERHTKVSVVYDTNTAFVDTDSIRGSDAYSNELASLNVK